MKRDYPYDDEEIVAIEFADWLTSNATPFYDGIWSYANKPKTSAEMWELFLETKKAST